MKIRTSFFWLVIVCLCSCRTEEASTPQPGQLPNVMVIYADDLGYGDLGCYGATGLQTPHIDSLASAGVRFTNGYATSATCSPSRYALLTGTYPWRNQQAKILPGTAPLIIDTAQLTLPKMLQQKGYHTGVVGKWHLGLGRGKVDWNGLIQPGPNQVGFDYSFIMAATQDRVPTVLLEDGQVVGLDPDDPLRINYMQNFPGEPTGKDHPELLRMKWHHGHNQSIVNGIPRIGYMQGGKSAYWVDEHLADTFLVKAQQFIQAHQDAPFFLYYALHQPHVPRTPHPRFAGKSGMGPRGDVILEADWCVGQLIQTLRQQGLLDNTLIIFSSDNGPVLNDGYEDEAVEKLGDHKPSGPLRGGKYSLFEAGTRVPLIVYWPGHTQAGVSDALISQLDFLASIASLTGDSIQHTDSQNLLNTLLGVSTQERSQLIIEATTRTALRQGDWVMIPPYKGPARNQLVDIELGNLSAYGLYNLSLDIGQQQNLAQREPQRLQEMIDLFVELRGAGYQQIDALELK